MDLDAHEIQALLRYHCAAIVEAIDDGGLKPSKWTDLEATRIRIGQLITKLRPSEKNMPPDVGFMSRADIENAKGLIG